MKVSFFYVVLLLSGSQWLMANTGFCQPPDQRMTTIGMDGEDLKTFFTKLKEQTGLSFVLPGKVAEYDNIAMPKARRSVRETLDLALQETDLTYKFLGNSVIIYERKDGAEKYSSDALTGRDNLSTVTGTVTDGATQLPIPGVNVFVKGTNRGTTTDSEGKFSIGVEGNEILVFTFIGFRSFETPVGDRTAIDVQMEGDVTALKEVEINAGYYTITEQTRTGNIARVSAKEIERQPVTSPLLALQGRVAGLDVVPNNGAPGSAVKIQIRGQSSLRWDGGYPLYIIDGVPIDSRPLNGASSLLENGIDPLASIDPANIASIEVLKDADATAIYGSRGANGVILITTKNALGAKKTHVDINVYRGMGKIMKKMELLDTRQYLEIRHEALRNANRLPAVFDYDLNGVWDTTRYTDWQDVLLGGTSNIADVQMNLSGGAGNTTFALGGGYHRETLVFPGDFGYNRVNGHYNMNHVSSDQKLHVMLSLSYGANSSRLFNNSNLLVKALTLPPVAPKLFDDNGELNWQPDANGESSWSNPLAAARNTTDVTNSSFLVNGNISYNLLRGLTLKTNLGYTDLNGEEILRFPLSARDPNAPSFGTATAESRFGINKRVSWIIEPQVSYRNENDNHTLDIMIGTTFQESSSQYRLTAGLGYTSDILLGSLNGAASTDIISDIDGQYRYAALFARLGYDWKGKYLLNLTGRRDGSSRFGPGYQFGNFGAVGLGWIFSKEDVVKNNVSLISFGKLRASYGITGNDQIGDYQYYDTYSTTTFPFLGKMGLSPTRLYNPNYAWESTHKLETALELGLLNDNLSFSASWYRHRSSNQLVQYKLPATAGFQFVTSNLDATIENSGWELVMNSTNINRRGIRWTTSINFSIPENRLIKFDNLQNTSYAKQYQVGMPLNVERRYIYTGVDPATGLYTFKDFDGDGNITDADKQFIRPFMKKFGGITNTIGYKGIELSFLVQFAFQQRPRQSNFGSPPGFNPTNQPVQVLDRWQQEGDVTDIQKISNAFSYFAPYGNFMQSDYWYSVGSFARLKTVSISYLLPGKLIENIRLERARIYIQGQNWLTFTNYVGMDPETGVSNNGNELPPLKMITGGIELKF